MLTDHLHGYQHLCRYIDEAWEWWPVFLFSQITLRPGTTSAFISLLSSSPAVTSWPPDQPTPSQYEPQITNSDRWLSSSGSSRMESCCVTSLSSLVYLHAMPKVFFFKTFKKKKKNEPFTKQSEKCNNSFTVSKVLHITTYNPVWDGQLFHDPKEDQSAVVWWLTGTSSSSHSIKYLLQRSIGEQNFKLKEPMARYNQTPDVIIKTLMLFYGSWWKKRLVFLLKQQHKLWRLWLTAWSQKQPQCNRQAKSYMCVFTDRNRHVFVTVRLCNQWLPCR